MKLYRIELTVMIMLALLFTYAAGVSVQQNIMSDGLIRLHVKANSNSVHDQEVKLIVRDAILEYCEPLLDNALSRQEAINRLDLQKIADIAKTTLDKLGETKSVSVSLKNEYYPTRDYINFSLPAGEYLGLRVEIGNAQGENWWCVVFPPLCNQAAEVKTEKNTLTSKYTIKFKTAEIISDIQNQISKWT